MSEQRVLTAAEAEAVISDLMETYGLGALPSVSVTEVAPATWRVIWEDQSANVAPMNSDAWHQWLEANIVSLAPERLETSES